MDPRQISCLAKLLRENGDKVLSSEYKLTLTGAILRALNDSFSLIVDPNEVCTPQTFQVLKPNNAKSEVFRELQFIYDFVQKAQILCLTTTIPNDDPFDGLIDITKFRSLRRLEIQRIPIEQIVGIQRLRAHLQEIICSKSIRSIQDIISHCGGDKSNGFLWNNLLMADFSYNGLKTIDCSMEFASNLQQLNLSHNQIVSVDAIKWLPNLKKLNLSYNSLSHIPSCIASRRLQTLILTNNFIEDLSGLARLDALSELNLSDNCILDHSALMPLSALIALQYLHLSGNPISCHPNHREETAKYLHKNTASVKFILDLSPLSSHEKSLIGHFQSYNTIWASRFAKGPLRSSGRSTPSRQTKENTPTSSVGSVHSFQLAGSTSSMGDSTFGNNDSMNTSQTSARKIRVRPAIIADGDSNDDAEIVKAKTKKKLLKTTAPTACREHLETKKRIEELRKEYGDAWLYSAGATKVQNVMGIQSSAPKSDGFFGIKSPTQTTEQLIDHLFPDEDEANKTAAQVGTEQQRTSTPINKNRAIAAVSETTLSDRSEYKSAAGSEQDTQTATNSSMNDTMFKSTIEDDPLFKLYDTNSANEPEPVSDAEENETIYLITIDGPQKNDLILIVSDQSIREKDALTTRTITKWNMTMLESCERIKADVLRLRFDTVKRDKKERTYYLEEGHGQKLDPFLRNILSKRPLSEMNQTIFRCANCATQFSRENLLRNIGHPEVKCIECKSTYVVEIKESTPPRPMKQPRPLEKSDSHSSIVTAKMAWKASSNNSLTINNAKVRSKCSASSFNESSINLKISQSQSSFDSNQSLIGSTTNCDQTNDLDLYFASRYGAPADSDVEILSNPSISSIEVLDSFSRHSSRKHSEDRHLHHSMYLQNQQPNVVQPMYKSVDATNDYGINSSSNSDIEELMNEPHDDDDHQANDVTHTVTHGTIKNAKKTILTGMNLTESSSSGSVTDSVCTAYEHHTVDAKMAVDVTSTSTIAEVREIDELVPSKGDETMSLSTMLGGLFSSTNMLMSRNGKSSASPKESSPCEEFRFSYTHFDNVDHRLKLFLYQNIFDDANEHLKWLVKGRIFNDSASAANADVTDGHLQSAIFVMSTTKWYILHIVADESDDISKWLKRQLFGTIDRVEMVRVLPWKIGVSFSLKFVGNIHFLLQDIMRTDSLLLFFANNPLPCYSSLEYQISERLSQKLLHVTDNVQLKMLAILNQCAILCDTLLAVDTSETHDLVAIIVTETNLYLTSSKYGWLADKLDQNIELINTQLMTNVVGVDPVDDHTFLINFLDEIENRDEVWKCKFETKSSLDSTFNAIAQSWEKLFQVPLAN